MVGMKPLIKTVMINWQGLNMINLQCTKHQAVNCNQCQFDDVFGWMGNSIKKMQSKAIRFSVPCVVEIDNHIGKSEAHIVARDQTDWYIESVTNEHGGEKDGEFVSPGLYKEIEAEVLDYFISASERQEP